MLDITVRRSTNEGQSWGDVPWEASLGSPRAAGITVGPDGAFYIGAALGGGPADQAGRIVRVEPSTGAMTVLSPIVPLANNSFARLGPPTFDVAGEMWIAYTNGQFSSSAVTLAYEDGASWAVVASASNGDPMPNIEVAISPSGTYVRAGPTFKLVGSALQQGVSGIPSVDDGSLVITHDSISLDGGDSFLGGLPYGSGGGDPVYGDSTLLNQRGRVLRRSGDSFYAPTGLRYVLPLSSPNTPALEMRYTDAGLVVLTDEFKMQEPYGTADDNQIALHSGEIPPLESSTGPLSSTFAPWLQRANQLRAQAGIPPLVGDPTISQAAENHSRYWTLNPLPQDPLIEHIETPGTPGFTGEFVSDRCAAVGAFCDSEIIHGIPSNQVDDWAATVYHRGLIMSKRDLLVGGAQVDGGLAVMDAGSAFVQGQDVQIGPTMFPRGSYDGELGFYGEVPDPGQCPDGQPSISAPYGTTISAWVPGGTLSNLVVAPIGGSPLAGCTWDGPNATVDESVRADFLPDDSLMPFTTYHASVTWTPTPQMGPQTIAWQFTTADGIVLGSSGANKKSPKSKCHPSVSRYRAKVKKGKAIGLRFTACEKGRLKIKISRLHPHGRKQRKPLFKRTVKIPEIQQDVVRIPTRRLKVGKYKLRGRLIMASGRTKTLNTTIQVTRAHKVRRR